MDDALRALNRSETAIAIAADIASRWDTMVMDNRYLASTNDDLARRLAETERQLADLSALVLRLVS